MLETIDEIMQRQIEAILSEPILCGNTIISSLASIEEAHLITRFKNQRYFFDLYTGYCSLEGTGANVSIRDCSQRFENNVMSVYAELVTECPTGTGGKVLKVQLTIPGDTYLVRNMICIPELLRQLISNPYGENNRLNSVFQDVLKINPSGR